MLHKLAQKLRDMTFCNSKIFILMTLLLCATYYTYFTALVILLHKIRAIMTIINVDRHLARLEHNVSKLSTILY